MSLFGLEAMGGPWQRRLKARRARFDEMPWSDAREAVNNVSPMAIEAAKLVWTRSAFSEYASAAAFAQIASHLCACGAPIDLIAAAGDFIADEILHAELSGRVAMSLGGAAPLEVDLQKLARPPGAPLDNPLLRAAELVVRTCCVGEALTVPILKATRAEARSPLLREVVGRIVRDESNHAEMGSWFLDWADARLSDGDRAYLGRVAGEAIASFAPIFGGDPSCDGDQSAAEWGVARCATHDHVFEEAVDKRVKAKLRARGIDVAPAA